MDRPRRLEVWRVRRGRLVLVVQSDFVDFDTILVVPLANLGTMRPTRDVNLLIEVEGRSYLVVGQQITAVLATDLRERVVHLPDIEDKVVKAIDRMLTNS
jgi:CcdB protein